MNSIPLSILDSGSGGTVDNAAVNAAIDEDPFRTRAATKDQAANFNFILVGDSIMAGVPTGGATSPYYLVNNLPNKTYFESSRATIINKAVSGAFTGDLVNHYTTGGVTDCYSYRPSNQSGKRAVVLVTVGINDYINNLSMVTALTNVKTYVSALKADGFEVWLGLPLPCHAFLKYDYMCRTAMATYIAGLQSYEVPDKKINFWSLVRTMNPSVGSSGSNWTDDGLHPNNRLYDTMADLINARAWSDDDLYGELELGAMAYQSTTPYIDGVATFASNPYVVANTGQTAGVEFQVAALGSNKKVTMAHVQFAGGGVPANGLLVSHWNGSGWNYWGASQEGTVIGNGFVALPKTVANLPANPVSGTLANVTDAASFVAGDTVAGGGSVKCLVQHNGTAWKMVLQLY